MDEQTPQQPVDEQAPAAPRVGVDEWVARHEGRLRRRSGWLGRAETAWETWPRPAWVAIAVAIAATFPFLTESDYYVRVGVNAILFALLALGLNVVVGWAGLLDLGYVAFYGTGAYLYAFLASSKFDIHLSTPLAILVVVTASALLGLLLGLPSRRLLGDYLAIVTLFFAQIFVLVTNNGNRIEVPWRDEPLDITGGPNGIPGPDPFGIFGLEAIEVQSYYFIALGAFWIVITALYFLNDSRTGRAWRAVREDPLAAAAMTMPVNRLKLLAFMFGAATAGLTGSIFAAVQPGAFPGNFELPLLITIYAMVILGGAGSLGGVVIGAVTITVLLELLRSADDARTVFYGAVLLGLVGLLRPWWKVGVVLGGVLVLGAVVKVLAPAVIESERGPVRGGGLLADAVEAWIVLPADPGTAGDVAFVVLVLAVLGLTLLRGWPQLLGMIPTIYLGAFVWENRLVFQPSVTRFLLLGALLVVMMNVRPQGLLGTAKVEIV
jgi:branched-chain amino acid transport system permease protein